MAVYRQQDSKFWWYKFTWNGQSIRRSTKQTNKRVAGKPPTRPGSPKAKLESSRSNPPRPSSFSLKGSCKPFPCALRRSPELSRFTRRS